MADSGTPVRVALIACSGLLGEIIDRTVEAQPDLEVVARLADVQADPTELDADIVLWNGADESRIAQSLSHASRRLGPRVIATLTDGKRAALWELVPHRTELGEPSPSVLLETIRGAEVRR